MLKRLFMSAASVLIIQLVASSSFDSAYAFGPISSPLLVNMHYDLDSAKGFEKVGGTVGTPEFVLRRGTMGTFNITLTSSEDAPVLVTLRLGGNAPRYAVWGGEGKSLPYGIIYNIEPDRLTLAPNSSATVTIRIAATSDTEMRSYSLSPFIALYEGSRSEEGGYSIVLTVTEGISLTTHTTNGTAYVSQTVTTSVTETKTAVLTTYTETKILPANLPEFIQSASIGIGIAVAGIAIALAISRRQGRG